MEHLPETDRATIGPSASADARQENRAEVPGIDSSVLNLTRSVLSVLPEHLGQSHLTDLHALRDEVGLLRTLIDNMPDLIYIKDRHSRFVISNAAHAAQLGAACPDEVVGKTDFDFFADHLASIYYDAEQTLMRTGDPFVNREEPGLDRHRSETWFSATKVPLRDAGGNVIGLIGISRDIGARKRAEWLEQDRRLLLERIARNDPLQDVLTQVLFILERQRPQWRCGILRCDDPCHPHALAPRLSTELADAMEKALTLARPELPTCDHLDPVVVDLAADPRWKACAEAAGRQGLKGQWLMPIFSGQGTLLAVMSIFTAVTRTPDATDAEVLRATVGLAAIAIEHQNLTDRLEFQASHDPLTQLPNRMLLEQRLRQSLALSDRNGNAVALFFLDVDGFKVVNDMLGHHAGDALLREIVNRLNARISRNDTLARMGGDEFNVIVPELHSRQDAISAGAKLLEAFAIPFAIAGHEIPLTASIGAAIYPYDGRDGLQLLRDADAAMNRAKSMGRNQVQFFTADIRTATMERIELGEMLRRAMDRSELLLHYQPEVCQKQGVVGLEALLRWQSPRLGMVAPTRFIPVAEETGLILKLGTWVLQEACRQSRLWQDQGLPPVKVAVNVSALQFAQPDFVATVERVLKEARLDSRNLELEITESILMQNMHNAIEKLQYLRDLGVTIAIDDFGTGYCSLAYLHRLPLDKLKVPRNFVKDINQKTLRCVDDAVGLTVIRAIVSLGKSLRMKVLAEGVETIEQRDFLDDLGCDLMQGYLFRRPVDAEEVANILAAPLSVPGLRQRLAMSA